MPPIKARDDTDVFEQYVSGLPSHQNAIDSLKGWVSAFPPKCQLVAGTMEAYNDPRIHWAMGMVGGVSGKQVLELGPLEGGHSYMLDQAGAIVDAIEANKGAFLRCLVTKEILQIKNVSFYLGDFMEWLRITDRSYDLVVASGVLYHMTEPVKLLELISARTQSLYLWTHFLRDEPTVPEEPPLEVETFGSLQVRSRIKSYLFGEASPTFCGGPRDKHRWLHGDDIISVLRELGFTEIELNHVDLGHQNGPAMSVFARRPVAP